VIRGFLVLLFASILCSGLARGQTVTGDLSYTKQTFFRIPFQTDPSERRLKQVQLYYSNDQGQSWHPYNSVAPDQHFFDFQASADGVYWFAVRTVDADGRGNPLNMQGARPGLKVCVDTQAPTIRLRALQPRDGEVGVEWDVRDDNLDAASLRLEYRLPAVVEWLPLGGELAASGQRYWKPAAPGAVEVRLKARDRADNWSEEKTTAFLQKYVKQVAGLIRCGEEERVANGEFAILAFNCDLADANDMRQKGAPVNGRIFKDAGILSYWYLAVPSNSAHPNAASLLSAFLLTKEGQDILWKTEKTSSHLVEGTYMYKFVKDQERQGVKFYANPVSDVVKNHENQSRVRQKFQDILAGK